MSLTDMGMTNNLDDQISMQDIYSASVCAETSALLISVAQALV